MTERKAVIDYHTVVECYEGNTLIKTIDVSDHSYAYAEDTAEIWEKGIIKYE